MSNKYIHTDHNGLAVSVIEEGHLYSVENIYNDETHNTVISYLDTVKFQKGPVPDYGVNGLTNEALLAILIDRTTCLNNQFPSNDNVAAIRHMGMALAAFNNRTKSRIDRGVEGKLEV